MDRADIVHENFLRRVADGDLPPVALQDHDISSEDMLGIFRAQVISRQLDRKARQMQAEGQGFYTIGSSGHEGECGNCRRSQAR